MASRKREFKCVGLSDRDAQLLGRELEKIARQKRVNNIAFLDKTEVFEIIEQNPKHPLRKLLDWDDASAARKHRIAAIGKLICTVQVVNVQVAPLKVYEPAYVSTKAAVRAPGSNALRRVNVMREDMLKHDASFVTHVNDCVNRLLNELRKLEHNATARALPANVAKFVRDVRASATANGF